ncbi:MAG: signal peptidase II [Oscillospiraceae bacterium]|nr:signal peptidase II [Oscillospiraceae bacterium]
MTKYIALATAAICVGLDQWIKAWAYAGLIRTPVISGVFYLTYLENTGAAFGIFQGGAFVLAIVSLVILGGIFYLLLSGKITGTAMIWGFSMIFSGGVGNAIDRLFRGFVIDYLDFSPLFGFPIFNFADCLVVIGTVVVVVYILFFEKNKPTQPAQES